MTDHGHPERPLEQRLLSPAAKAHGALLVLAEQRTARGASDVGSRRDLCGKIHVVNNLYTPTGNSYCTNSGFETHVLVENNVYIGVKNPLSPDANGDMLARNNVFTNTTGTNTANGVGFCPPYSYTPDPTDGLEAAIRSGAGPH